jgi:hypothetical protein
MPTFSDNESRKWDLRIDIESIRRVRAAHGIDLAKVFASPDALSALNDDVCLLVDVLWELVATQAETRSVTAEQFGRSLSGDSLDSAIMAFEEAVIEFLPQSQRRDIVRRIIEGQRAAQTQATMRLTNAIRTGLIEQGIAETLARVDERLAAMRTNPSSILGIGPSSASSPDPSPLSPDPIPSVN